MRKINKLVILAFVLVLALSTALVACGTSTTTVTTTVGGGNAVTSTVTTTAPAKTVTNTATSTITQQVTGTPKVYTLRMQSFSAPGTYFADKVIPEEFIKPLEAASQGQLKVQHSGSGSIVPDSELITAVAKGVVDMGLQLNTYYTSTCPVASYEYGYPGQYASMRDLMQFLKQGGRDVLRNAYKEQLNVYWLAPLADFSLDMVSTKPIPDIASIKGMKIRATGGLGTVLGKAGASVVMMPGTELYTALQTKVIDAAAYGCLNDAFSIGLPDIAKHAAIKLYANRYTADLFVNLNYWNSLPANIQNALQLVCSIMNYEGIYYNDWQNGLAYAKYKAAGGTLYDWSPADRALMTSYSQELMEATAAKDKYAAQALEIFKSIWAQR